MDTSAKQQKAVQEFRKLVHVPRKATLLQLQQASLRDRPVQGPIWVSKVSIPRLQETSGDSVRDRFWRAFTSRSEGCEVVDRPEYARSLEAEWAGHRKGAKNPRERQPSLPERDAFKAIEDGKSSPVTIFYLNGGAWYIGGPAASRPIVSQLCHLSGGRAFSVLYRLAPQHTITSCLLDAIVAYFYLLSPPPGAFHDPVPASTIVLAGESAGTTLHLGLIQFLQYLRHEAAQQGDTSPTLHINGRDVPLDMPAGCAFISPPLDLPFSLPSTKTRANIDWLQGGPPWLKDDFPADSIWPTTPPRGSLHCDNSAQCHPFICPSTWRDWTGAPPMWIACGQETHGDGTKVFVRNLRESGVPVQYCEYEGMPHVFCVVLPRLPQSRHCFGVWGDACRRLVTQRDEFRTRGVLVRIGDLETRELDMRALTDVTFERALEMMRAERDRSLDFVWTGPKTRAARM